MKLTFLDLFNDDGDQLTAKKNIRIGALVIPNGHAIHPSDPKLGLPIDDWRDKQFDVDIDQDHVIIKQVID